MKTIQQIAELGRRNAHVIYSVGSNVSLTTKSSKSSLWVETGILHFPVSFQSSNWGHDIADAKHEGI